MRDILMDWLRGLVSFDQAHPLLFTDFYFWAFFALVFAGFSLLKDRLLLRNAYLFFVSLFFYFKTGGLFLLLLLFCVVFNYAAALCIGSSLPAGGAGTAGAGKQLTGGAETAGSGTSLTGGLGTAGNGGALTGGTGTAGTGKSLAGNTGTVGGALTGNSDKGGRLTGGTGRADAAGVTVSAQGASCTRRRRKALMILAVVTDFAVLAYYKYAYFFTDIVNNLFGTSFEVRDYIAEMGNSFFGAGHFSVDSIILPVGISFFTFQAVSYVVDVYKGKIAPVRGFFDFGFYLTFFPSLVAGPIVRAVDFVPQLHRRFSLGRRHFGIAVFWILNGLAKKLILSDYLAVNLNDRVFENPLLYTGFENLSALFSYSLQVYADFSGYTDIATGVAMLMGFWLPLNFNSPYKARNAGEFWKRWHITLSSWLKDYLYIPLGGNRNSTFGTYAIIIGIAFLAAALSKSWWIAICVTAVIFVVGLVALLRPSSRKGIRTNLNRMDTMLLGGLWHGASWNFMIWGGLNGLGMLTYQAWKGMNVYVRALLTGLLTAALWLLFHTLGKPVFHLFFWWLLLTFAGAFVRAVYALCGGKAEFRWLSTAWAVLQTFVFITFTRLFFRSGSNLDPAVANQVAWDTAKNMVGQIGGQWNLSLIPQIVGQYRMVFFLLVAGMVIHWLPERFKRRYRLWFASLPLGLMAAVTVLIVVILYQFVTSDLQTFIYFQF